MSYPYSDYPAENEWLAHNAPGIYNPPPYNSDTYIAPALPSEAADALVKLITVIAIVIVCVVLILSFF